MEPSPPRSPMLSLPRPPLPLFGATYTPRTQVNLGRLAGPPEGITPFTVARRVRTLATEEQERGSPVVEPMTRGISDLTISDQVPTPFHRPDPPSPTSKEANPNPNRLDSRSPLWISPLGNQVIRRVIRLPSSTRTRPTADHLGAITDVHPLDSTVRQVRFRL
jgi:hypothetical protein